MVTKVHGSIGDISGSVSSEDGTVGNVKVEATLQLTTLSTGQAQRDAHLKSADFFDIERFPTITFVSTKVVPLDGNEYDVIGNLTIHGVTREVTLRAEATDEVANPYGGFKIGVSASTKINREDFGMTWNQALEAGGVVISKEVHIEIDAELDRPSD
jgi:polyisoprenoid-binding protein YceI